MNTETIYVILNCNTGKMIECHDEVSKEYAHNKVAIHNEIWPHDAWKISIEEI